ncbi:hypothetical protein BJ912DRAFT_232016 [Pholiota molesta]|nr:hypothetical protein BJ912DRAFT_232016 [Pholiota molesta]
MNLPLPCCCRSMGQWPLPPLSLAHVLTALLLVSAGHARCTRASATMHGLNLLWVCTRGCTRVAHRLPTGAFFFFVWALFRILVSTVDVLGGFSALSCPSNSLAVLVYLSRLCIVPLQCIRVYDSQLCHVDTWVLSKYGSLPPRSRTLVSTGPRLVP